MAHKDPSKRSAYNRRYREQNREKLNAYWRERARRRYAEDDDYREKVKAKTREIPSFVSAARQRVYYALKRGEIVRPSECSKCGKGCKPEAAHENYHERLAIRWLCRSCHRTWDMEHPKIIREEL